MLSPREIRRFYDSSSLNVPSLWNLSRKHFRIETAEKEFVKLNHCENRLNERSLRKYLQAYAPSHVYFSVLNWLFPERVGKKYKAHRAVPVSGEYVVDVDWYMGIAHRVHEHYVSPIWNVCHDCLELSKMLTVQACEAVEYYYSQIAIVFSGERGFHIHVLDFNYKDWTKRDEKDPVKTQEAARFKFSKALALQTYTYDREHFILSVDPMRVISVPGTLNAETGLVCKYIGDRSDLELQTLNNILVRSQRRNQASAQPFSYCISFAFAQSLFARWQTSPKGRTLFPIALPETLKKKHTR